MNPPIGKSPLPNISLALCVLLVLAQLSPSVPREVCAAFAVVVACFGAYTLGMLNERIRRIKDAEAHWQEITVVYQATTAALEQAAEDRKRSERELAEYDFHGCR